MGFRIGWFIDSGYSPAGWASVYAPRDYGDWGNPRRYVELARACERSALDFLLLADSTFVPNRHGGSMSAYLRHAICAPMGDPTVIATRMLAATEHIGVVVTLNTSEYEPATLARLVSGIDDLSDHRAGWNVVTGFADRAMRNYGKEGLGQHDRRYDIAEQYIGRAEDLWARTGRPRPIIAQAGASPRGRDFAARHADLIVSNAATPETMKEYRNDIQRLLRTHGREPDDCKVMFLTIPFIGETDEQAQRMYRARHDLVSTDPEADIAIMSLNNDVDFSIFDPDVPMGQYAEHVETAGTRGLLAYIMNVAKDRTLREMVASQAMYEVVGTPTTVADHMEALIDEVGGDGFIFNSDYLDQQIVESVLCGLVPELQRRGLVPSAYASA